MATDLLVALRRLVVATIVVIFILIAAVLAYGNPTPIALDIGFMRIEAVSVTVALAITFSLGAVFGALCSTLGFLKHMRERRALRRELSRAEGELSRVLSLPSHDAD